MKRMFSDCSSLKELNLTNFNTENVRNMGSMFRGCGSLKILNVSNFNTINVINMENVFDENNPDLQVYLKIKN